MSFFVGRLVDPPPPTIEGRLRRQRVDHDEVERQIREARRLPLAAGELHGFDSKLTLAQALDLLEQNGGTVEAGDHGTLNFSVSERLPHQRRHRVVRAARVLDASRELVHAHLKAGRPLPDRPPAAGGGLA